MDVKTDPRIAPVLRQAANGRPDLVMFDRKPVSNTYINMAALDKTDKRLCCFTVMEHPTILYNYKKLNMPKIQEKKAG